MSITPYHLLILTMTDTEVVQDFCHWNPRRFRGRTSNIKTGVWGVCFARPLEAVQDFLHQQYERAFPKTGVLLLHPKSKISFFWTSPPITNNTLLEQQLPDVEPSCGFQRGDYGYVSGLRGILRGWRTPGTLIGMFPPYTDSPLSG